MLVCNDCVYIDCVVGIGDLIVVFFDVIDLRVFIDIVIWVFYYVLIVV